jgi:predicted ATP-dependent serine protease
MSIVKTGKRGRPKKEVVETMFDPSTIELKRGSDLKFSASLFKPMITDTHLDIILSTDGGVMPGTNMMIAGGPGSGKSTVVLDILAKLTKKGFKCLFVSGEMDEIAYYKYCKRLQGIDCIQTLFLKNNSDTVKPTLEYVFEQGYDIIAIDSVAEVLTMYKDAEKSTISKAETWLLDLQSKHKKGDNKGSYYTTFINIQQMTKGGDFVGSNKLKHMMEAYCYLERSKDGLERSLHFEKNRDCDKDFKVFFSIYNGTVSYSYEFVSE